MTLLDALIYLRCEIDYIAVIVSGES